jgi:ABC-type multidrug transport system ATPase subunit
MERGVMVRSGTIEEITAAESHYRVVRLAWLGDAARLGPALKANEKVSGVMLSDGQGVFKFAGTEEDLAVLLRALVEAGVQIVSFSEVKQTVEDLYLKLSRHEVM